MKIFKCKNQLILFPMKKENSDYYEFEIGFFSGSCNSDRTMFIPKPKGAFKTIYKGELIKRESPSFFYIPEKRTLGESVTFESIRDCSSFNDMFLSGEIKRFDWNKDNLNYYR